jgi:hypothetical protein
VVLSNVRAVVTSAENSRSSYVFYGAPGIGLISRHGDVWSGYSGTTDRALTLAGGLRFKPRTSPISLRYDFETYASRTSFSDRWGASSRALRHIDFLSGASITIPLGRRPRTQSSSSR